MGLSLLAPRVGMVLRFIVGVAVVFVLLTRADADLTSLLAPRNLVGLLMATGLLLMALALSALRWKLVLGDGAVGLLSLFRLYVIGWFFSLFLPTSVGGDLVRASAVARARVGVGAALSSIVLERLIGVAALAFYLVLGVLVAPRVFAEVVSWSSIRVPRPAILVGMAFLFVACIPPLVVLRERIIQRGPVREAIGLLAGLWQAPRRAAAAVAVSLVVQAVYIVVWLVLARVFLIPVASLAFLVFVPFISLAAMLPVTVGGLGVREGAWALILSAYGVNTGVAVAFSLSYFVSSLVLGAAGGILFATSGLSLHAKIERDFPHRPSWQESLEGEAATTH